MAAETITPNVSIHWRVEKFDGEPPKPGEDKQPVEIIEGGDDIPTTIHRPGEEVNHGTH